MSPAELEASAVGPTVDALKRWHRPTFGLSVFPTQGWADEPSRAAADIRWWLDIGSAVRRPATLKLDVL